MILKIIASTSLAYQRVGGFKNFRNLNTRPMPKQHRTKNEERMKKTQHNTTLTHSLEKKKKLSFRISSS